MESLREMWALVCEHIKRIVINLYPCSQTFQNDAGLSVADHPMQRRYRQQVAEMDIHQISELESVKQAIESEDKPILVCMVDEHSSEKENAKIINLISDAYKARGKINKWRYIFVADSPLYAKRILSSDFAIKNADVYAVDELDAICQRIDAYRSEFWQIRKLAGFSEDLIYQLAILKQRLTVQAEQNKPIERINELEERAIKIVDSCGLSYRCDRTSFEKGIDQCFDIISTVP